MEVSNYADFKTFKTRVVIAYKQDVYVAWSFAETFEDAEISLSTRLWNYAREVDPYRKLKEAFKQGKKIQYKDENNWLDCITIPNFSDYEYRIKPESKYIPFDFSDAEKLVGKIVKTKSDFVATIVSVYIDDVVIIGNVQYTLKTLFESFTFLDGSTCGKLKQD